MKEKDMSYFECFAGGNFILHKPLISDERSAGCLVGYFFNSPSPSSNVCMYVFFLSLCIKNVEKSRMQIIYIVVC